ncbi:MAG: alkaline phosphatase family protein [Sphingobium sp.]
MTATFLSAMAVSAQEQAPPPAAAPKPAPPQLVVAIAVDQFSADLFAHYRSTYTGGLKRLADGVVFPSGYQSHAATETCPGHSTILTGYRPGHTGIIANNWFDQSVAREEKQVYCMEDPAAPGSTPQKYTRSLMRLRVPTLGDRIKDVDAQARLMAVSGKDRGAMLLGGKKADTTLWWDNKGFGSYAGYQPQPVVTAVNASIANAIAAPRAAFALPAHCEAVSHAVTITPTQTVGTGRFERAAGDDKAFRVSPELDAATLAMAAALVDDAKLGQRGHTDVLGISLSGTDVIGHTFGPGGGEMCIQMAQLDASLGDFFGELDRRGIDYLVMLTADHGGVDAVERNRENGAPDAQRVDIALTVPEVNKALEVKTGLKDVVLGDGAFGDLYIRNTLTAAQRATALKAALALYRAHPQVETVFTHAELQAAPEPSGPPESWSLLAEAKASFDPERSGDFVVLLKPRVMPLAVAGKGPAATHGSPWGYDRRVPILFWRKGIVPFEQPLGVETVDIMPTIAAEIGLAIGKGPDGRCLDIHAGPENICPAQ